MSEHSPLEIRDHGAVRVMTLNRPQKKNAFSLELVSTWAGALAEADRDDDVKAVVVTSQGDTFSAGVDVNVFLEIGQSEDASHLQPLSQIHEDLRGFSKPLVAAVQGKAVGMGVTLLPHFDLVYASERASFLTPFVRLGLVLEYGSSFTLPRLIGRQRTAEMILRAQPVDAATATDWGLVTRVFAHEALMDQVLAIASDIAEAPPGAVADAKRLMRAGEDSSFAECIERENEVLSERYGSAENVAAVQAFFDRS